MRPLSRRARVLGWTCVLVFLLALISASTALAQGDQLVTTGSPSTPFSQNKQNEPAIAVDPTDPSILVAGANEEIDLEACNVASDSTCPFTPGVGSSGVYFSLNGGGSWIQPTYTGWSARNCLGSVGPDDPECQPSVGPIGTVPNYFEQGLVSDGDPGVVFGPRPDTAGHFSWSNGSRLYYSNLTSAFPAATPPFKGFEAIAVSRTDNLRAAAGGSGSAWMDPVIATKQSATTFSDKSQIWADNASSSHFFGNVYVCDAAFRSQEKGHGGEIVAQPLVVSTSTDGGASWNTKQVTSASGNPFNPIHGFGRSFCNVRTDSDGTVYVVATQFGSGTPGHEQQILIRSFDGGGKWTKPQVIGPAVDTCFLEQFDGSALRCVMDGIGGARDGTSMTFDIANGAPTGQGATNELVRSWVDGSDGVNNEHVLVSYSTNGGSSWSTPTPAETPGDRGLYSAIAISPQGTDAYLVYNAFTTPLLDNTTTPRALVGVVKHADVDSSGAFVGWTELHRADSGDPRGSSQNNIWLEFLGDYVSVTATSTFGAGVWNDTRNAADCPAVDSWRADAQTAFSDGTDAPVPPAVQQDCPANFGNSDIFGGTYPDPTP